MKITALGLLVSTAASLMIAVPAQAQTTATTPPVGYYTLNIVGAADNVMSLPMVRDSVFAGTVGSNITATGFTAQAGQSAPVWTANQFVYQAGVQRLTYYVEFTSGNLRGLYYKISTNGTAGQLTLDTEGDNLTTHSLLGGSPGLTVGDSIVIRPYWTIKDVFESNGTPVLTPRPTPGSATDDVLVPNYTAVDKNKAAGLTIYYFSGLWRAAGQGGDFGDFVLRPNESFIVRRRTSAPLSMTNLGSVLMNRSVSFVAGGDGVNDNDTYISVSRPAAVSLDNSGLADVNASLSFFTHSTSPAANGDQLLAFNPPTGQNEAPPNTYFFFAGLWRKVGSSSSTIGADTFLEPGKSYIIRKKAASSGKDWVNSPNY